MVSVKMNSESERNMQLENFAIVRKIALNLLKKSTDKESLRSKRLKSGWN
jgi:predicted transposase YbfD/YdcC